jgi:pyruvate dehydrogenase E1 component alpha subunit
MAKKKESAHSREDRQKGQSALDSGEGHAFLQSMILQRRLEERIDEAYALGKVGGFCHLYIGQEAISTGTMAAIRP